MKDVPSKLDALGDLLDVRDDSGDLERPEPTRPIGEILRRGRRRGDEESTETDRQVGPSSPEQTPIPTPSAEPHPAHDGAGAPLSGGRRPSLGLRRDGRRSSANVPVTLSVRLAAAKKRRWELSQLLANAILNVDIDPAEADGLLEAIWGDTRVQRAYLLSAADLDRLDELGEQWRMNRSQVIAVIVPLELDRLGL